MIVQRSPVATRACKTLIGTSRQPLAICVQRIASKGYLVAGREGA